MPSEQAYLYIASCNPTTDELVTSIVEDAFKRAILPLSCWAVALSLALTLTLAVCCHLASILFTKVVTLLLG